MSWAASRRSGSAAASAGAGAGTAATAGTAARTAAAGAGADAALGRPQPVAVGALAAPPEVVAAIAAAVEACWPRARRSFVGGPGEGLHGRAGGAPEYVWRMSGRWWSKPVPLRRDRPWSDHGGEHGQLGTGGA